ncbi:MAG: LytTR family DNA-binding domain-containing protein [Pseudomonadota bacterium]
MAIVVCVMVFAVLAGPFGTLTTMGTGERVLLWVPLIALSVVMGWISNLIAQVVLEDRHTSLVEAMAVTIMTIVYAPFVVLSTSLMNPDVLLATGGVVQLVFYVFIVVVGVAVIRHCVLALQPGADLMPGPNVAEPRLLQRLPKALRASVLRLSARDHMVEVVTRAGVAQVRLRLCDAVAEMEPIEGFMAHRSHWVAKDAVLEGQRRAPGKVYLKLTNGDLVPVSRTFRSDWMATGLLEPCSSPSNSDAASVQHVERAQSAPQSSPRA